MIINRKVYFMNKSIVLLQNFIDSTTNYDDNKPNINMDNTQLPRLERIISKEVIEFFYF